jgi:F0F1-type ATP synthase assembly protein I
VIHDTRKPKTARHFDGWTDVSKNGITEFLIISREVVIGIEITVVIGIITCRLVRTGNTPWMTDGESNFECFV